MEESQVSVPHKPEPRPGIHDRKNRRLSSAEQQQTITDDSDSGEDVTPEVPATSMAGSSDPAKIRASPKRKPAGKIQNKSLINSSQNAELTENASDDDYDALKVKTTIPTIPKDSEHLDQSNNLIYLVSFILAIIAVAAAGWLYYWYRPHNSPPPQVAKGSSCEHFLQLHSKYPNTDDLLWHTLIVGVNRSINDDPGEPATFIFLYNSTALGQSLLEDVTRIALDCFGSPGAIWRSSNDFTAVEDYGNALDQYREQLKSQGVLVVRDLDRVPPTAAKVFFSICDSYEPLVHKAVIFFTIDISRSQVAQSEVEQRSPTAIAERILKDLWRGELQPNVLDPLVVRLTENVFRIV